jgi:ABC-type Co2+ transport system permease subunit
VPWTLEPTKSNTGWTCALSWTLNQYLVGLVPLVGFLWYRKEQGSLDRAVYVGGYLLPIGLAEVVKTVVLRRVGGTKATVTAASGLIGRDSNLCIVSSIISCLLISFIEVGVEMRR